MPCPTAFFISKAKKKDGLPSGKLLHYYGKSPFSMGQSTISTGPFSIAMLVYQRVCACRLMVSKNLIAIGDSRAVRTVGHNRAYDQHVMTVATQHFVGIASVCSWAWFLSHIHFILFLCNIIIYSMSSYMFIPYA